MVGWFLKLALRRLSAQWRSLLTIVAGVLLAAVIGASVPLYTAAIAQVGMVQRLEQNPAQATNIYTRLGLDVGVEDGFAPTWAALDQTVNAAVDAAFAPYEGWLSQSVNWAESTNVLPVQAGQDIEGGRLRLAYYAGLRDRVEIVAGAWPAEPTDDTVDLEVALSAAAAAAMGVAVGDTVVLDQRGWETSRLITTRISGLLREASDSDSYFFAPSPLRVESSNQWRVETNLITTRASMERVNAAFLPDTRVQLGWRLVFDPDALDFSQVDAAVATVRALPERVEAAVTAAVNGDDLTVVFETDLASILSGYRGEVDELNVPFGLLLLQLAALVLFFLVVMGALVRRSERREIAMMQSRGAPDGQLLLLRGLETAMICLLAMIVAPTLARWLLLVLVPLFTTIDALTLSLSTTAYLYAGAAALVALVMLMVTLVPLLRRPLVSAGGVGERSGAQTWWQRYYLDLVVLVIGLAALWRLVSTESVVATRTGDGSTQADPLLLLAPTLLVFALGSVLLRLFPVVMSALSRYFSGRGRVELTLSGWQVSREPLHYGRITFLLALAISIGWFAISFQDTVVSSQTDQAGYATGADVRLIYEGKLPEIDAVRGLDGVADASVVTRLEPVPVALDGGLDDGTVLAVDSETFSRTAYWRDDLGRLRVLDEPFTSGEFGEPLPAGTQQLRVGALYAGVNTVLLEMVDDLMLQPLPQRLLQGDLTVEAQIRDGEGNVQRVPMTPDNRAFLEQAAIIREAAEAEAAAAVEAGEIASLFQRDFAERLYAEQVAERDDGPWLTLVADFSMLGLPPGEIRLDGFVLDSDIPSPVDFIIMDFTRQGSSMLLLRDLVTLTADGATTQGWLTEREWGIQPGRNTVLDLPLPEPDDIADRIAATDVLVFRWSQTDEAGALNLFVNAPELTPTQAVEGSERVSNALPVLVSQSFAELNAIETGQQFNLFLDNTTVWFEVRGVVTYYPTIYNEAQAFVVVEQGALLERFAREIDTTIQPNEIWVNLDTDTTQAMFIDQLGEAQNSDAITEIARTDVARNALATDPLAVGLIGLLFFSFLVGIALSVVSLLTYATLTVQSRRAELSVLRAIGMSPARIVSSIAFEQTLVMSVAVLLGLVIGFFLSKQVLPTLSRNTAGSDVTPPFLIQQDVGSLLAYVVVIALVLALALLLSALLIRRLTNAQALRQVEV